MSTPDLEFEQNIPPHKDSTLDHIFDDQDLDTVHPNISPIPVLPELSVALGLLVFVFSITYIGINSTFTKTKQPVEDFKVVAQIQETADSKLHPTNAFENTQIQAHSAIVWDVKKQKVIFNKNADDQLPLASVTKLMTALVAYELLDPKDRVTVSLNALKAEGDSGLVDGEEFTMQNLADLTLISSSNDGASVLSANAGKVLTETSDPDRAFVIAMNLRAEELGLTKTYFENSTGLDLSPSKAGAYGSARDVALLMDYIVSNVTDAVALTKIDITNINNSRGQYHIAKNTNEVVKDIDGLIASKTGYTELAGGNLVIAFNAGLNRPIVVVVLGSSQEGRFVDTLSLIQKTRTYLARAE